MVDFKKLLEDSRGKPGNLNNYVERTEQSKARHNIENRSKTHPTVSVTVAGADYAIKFGYDAALLKKLKDAVPESERTWHKGRKVWLVSPEGIENAIKDRGKRVSAYGSVNGEWASEFPEDVLRSFFEGREVNQKPDGLQTLYRALCVFESVMPEEIKKAYKRLARQWHPDVCQEDNAAEMFRKINEAYLVLIDPEKKARYDAGLYFERQGHEQDTIRISRYTGYGYRAPLRCGQVTARGTVRLMRFVVTEILNWDDVIRDGKVMTSTWPKGADTFQILWV